MKPGKTSLEGTAGATLVFSFYVLYLRSEPLQSAKHLCVAVYLSISRCVHSASYQLTNINLFVLVYVCAINSISISGLFSRLMFSAKGQCAPSGVVYVQ